MVHRRANCGGGRAVLSFGDGEEGAQWGPVKSGSAEFMILFFPTPPSKSHHKEGN